MTTLRESYASRPPEPRTQQQGNQHRHQQMLTAMPHHSSLKFFSINVPALGGMIKIAFKKRLVIFCQFVFKYCDYVHNEAFVALGSVFFLILI